MNVFSVICACKDVLANCSWTSCVCCVEVILAIGITWLICVVLTMTSVFPSDPDKWGYGAKTNIHMDVLSEASWFRVPYPGACMKFHIDMRTGVRGLSTH